MSDTKDGGGRASLRDFMQMAREADALAFGQIHVGLERLVRPRDACSAELVRQLTRIIMRQRRLDELEEELTDILLFDARGYKAGDPAPDGPDPRLQRFPSLATLYRCRPRIERDWKVTIEHLDQLGALAQQTPESIAQARAAAEQEARLRMDLAKIRAELAAPRQTLDPAPRVAPEPATLDTPPASNRHERRRQEALQRQRGRAAAA